MDLVMTSETTPKTMQRRRVMSTWSHHAENRFPLFYYADAEFKKEERRETQLIIDTRTKTLIANPQNQDDYDDMKEPPLQCAIKTK